MVTLIPGDGFGLGLAKHVKCYGESSLIYTHTHSGNIKSVTNSCRH